MPSKSFKLHEGIFFKSNSDYLRTFLAIHQISKITSTTTKIPTLIPALKILPIASQLVNVVNKSVIISILGIIVFILLGFMFKI